MRFGWMLATHSSDLNRWSRGLGGSQIFVLKAMYQLERESNFREFYVGTIHDKLYEISPDMQELERQRLEASKAFYDLMDARAKAGDSEAIRIKWLGAAIKSRRKRMGRIKHRRSPSIESNLNLSRTLATLENRGLVARNAVKGNGWASLTDKGRSAAAELARIVLARRSYDT